MRSHWNTTTLGVACEFINGLWKGVQPPFVHVGVIRNTNFAKDGALDDTDIAYLDVEVKKFAKRRLQFGDIILEKSGGGPKQPVGRVALFDKTHGDFSFSNFTAAIRVKDPATLDPLYLHRYLHWLYLSGCTEAMQSHSTGIRNLNGDAYKAISVTYPPLSEQQRIVAILDEAFEAIATAKANAEKNLQNARELFKSHLSSLFPRQGEGGVAQPLAELCDPTRVITYGVIKLGEQVSAGVPCLRTSNVRWLRVETEGMKRIAPELSTEYSRTILRGGEVLVSVRGTLGGVAVVPPEMAGWNVSREVAVVPIDSTKVNPEFLSYLLGSETSQQWLGAVKKGATYVGINIEDLRQLPVSAPAPRKQMQIVEHLGELKHEARRLEFIHQKKLTAIDELKKSLLHQAFTGQL